MCNIEQTSSSLPEVGSGPPSTAQSLSQSLQDLLSRLVQYIIRGNLCNDYFRYVDYEDLILVESKVLNNTVYL